jgi:hypothetical protein
MLRQWAVRLFGVQAEIDDLRRQVAELSWDEPFGMWTRAAFIRMCRDVRGERRLVAFLDLNEIGDMNLRYGYSEVDRRIRMTFGLIRGSGDLIGRWYSGDEIVIVFNPGREPYRVMARLRENARKYGITFTEALGDWEPERESIVAVIDNLSRAICAVKRPSSIAEKSRGEDDLRQPQIGFINRRPQPENAL